jgi:DNA adenine methylase
MTQFVPGERYASDSNPYIIAYWQAVQSGWLPPEDLSAAQYAAAKASPANYPPELVAFAGFGCSFGGKWFAGYSKRTGTRDYVREARALTLKMRPAILGVSLACKPYNEVEIPPNAVVYCDPPYANTTEYKGAAPFGSAAFWEWARSLSLAGTPVYVSEFSAPSDFHCTKAVIRTETMARDGGGQLVFDRLFTHVSNT